MPSYREVRRCRACGNSRLSPVLSLGRQALTGVFPRTASERLTAGPLDLVRCDPAGRRGACGLVQLRQTYDKREMYGRRYGYQSGLNRSMVEHLESIAERLARLAPLRRGDLVVDIGSNDGTLLRSYPRRGLRLCGVDPSAAKFRRRYPPGSVLIPDFFSAEAVARRFGGLKARVVTSIAMFYDLDSPPDFMRQVRELLDREGVWLMEQSYLPAMMAANAYDTICHEHLEYYALSQIDWMARRVGLKVLDVGTNDVNGGSFQVLLARDDSERRPAAARVARMLRREERLLSPAAFRAFRARVERHRRELRGFFRRAKARGRTIVGYGASTKGNVILQYCGITREDLPCIGEVNREKFGCWTPGTLIPIVSEARAKALKPDYLLVLPWHFKRFMLKKEERFRRNGGRLFFPLPRLEVR